MIGRETFRIKCNIHDSFSATGDSRSACMRGVVYALIDNNTWDVRYALPFCAVLSQQNDRIGCFQASAQYLTGTLEKLPAEIAKDCAQHLSRPARCIELSSR